MDGAGTRMRRGLLRRWSCAGLSWKTHQSASALYCPRTALFARHDRLLGKCHGRPAFLCGQLRRRSGLLIVLREQIVPRLKADVPNQPTEKQLEADPLLSRFTIVFDR